MFPQHEPTVRQDRRQKEASLCCQQTRALINDNCQGMVIVDRSDIIRYANPAAERMLGKEIVAPGMPSPFLSTGRQPEETTLSIAARGTIYLELSTIETEWDRIPSRLVTFSDVTDRKSKEKELRKMYRAVMDSPVMVVITDAVGRIEFINPRYTEVTGYSYQDITEANLFTDHSLQESPATMEMIRQAVTSGTEWRGEVRNRRKNGEIYHHTLSIAPIQDRHGATTNWVAVMEEITERKRYEEQLRSSERQLAEAQKIAHLGSWKRYLDSGKSYWSDEMYRLLGLEPGCAPPSQELFLSMVHPDDRPRIEALARDAVREKKSFSSYLCRIVRPDGTLRVLAGQGEILTDRTGAPMMIGTALDVTEREMMAEEIGKLNATLEARAAELEVANRELETFGYTVCHDLRSPLTNIQGYTQVLAELCRDQLDEQCQRYLEEICRGTERMNRMIETLLHFSLITRRNLAFSRVNLSDIVRQTAYDLQVADPDRQVTFQIEEDVLVRGDEELLRVVMANLLGNAWKYSGIRDVALIEFGTIERQGELTYFVKDNGAGFDPADAEELFVPFHRAAAAPDINGHGIGLATVKRIIDRHGGRIWAEGAPDRGATIYFTMPPP